MVLFYCYAHCVLVFFTVRYGFGDEAYCFRSSHGGDAVIV
ncbi:hypothetical protein APHCR_0869 [Anaplasma phagocytophilum str. CR1007]|uniref:Uncharacterized protein n=1 Tax=Anaplasma phagocytophilum str. NCH-1 TaxID=1359161 RepID=A0A0F3NKX3_ANAPH|nr:hypothetical protein APHWEB_0623 [Anaplasma phagocytophilum str. Webster]KJV68367.1 hypothetical protein EPHNCH_0102 [Anaplasma phagocytophilum str. NCH-1]KJV83093.1 hypothetical protein APHHGE2_0126 [Anaplasma phagocytophilum str. HGE2]KJV86355.1 hypothetical protein APHNYW_1438 [Anaplasma phagocytophilum str. ApNYW]KJZ98344.1 hypothetical protein APHCR_0869 [Anaplasma phagocytophilum str. CR1007]